MLPSEIPSSSQAIDNNRYSQIHLVPCCLAAKAKTDPTQKVRTIVLSIKSEVPPPYFAMCGSIVALLHLKFLK